MATGKDAESKMANRIDRVQHDYAPEGSPLPWYKQPNLRQLYFMMVFLFLGSTTLGYDGSLLNGLQTMTTWQDCRLHLDIFQPLQNT